MRSPGILSVLRTPHRFHYPWNWVSLGGPATDPLLILRAHLEEIMTWFRIWQKIPVFKTLSVQIPKHNYGKGSGCALSQKIAPDYNLAIEAVQLTSLCFREKGGGHLGHRACWLCLRKGELHTWLTGFIKTVHFSPLCGISDTSFFQRLFICLCDKLQVEAWKKPTSPLPLGRGSQSLFNTSDTGAFKRNMRHFTPAFLWHNSVGFTIYHNLLCLVWQFISVLGIKEMVVAAFTQEFIYIGKKLSLPFHSQDHFMTVYR